MFLLQEVGIYRYAHPLQSSPQYKEALADLEGEMKASIKRGEAVSGTKKWAINGSEKDGARMVADLSKLMLRAYNNEADSLVRTMKPYARDTAIRATAEAPHLDFETRSQHEDRDHRSLPRATRS